MWRPSIKITNFALCSITLIVIDWLLPCIYPDPEKQSLVVNHKTSVMSFSYLRWHPSFDRPYMHTFCGNVNRASSIPHLFISSASCFWYSWPSRKIAAVFILMGVSLLWNSNPHLEQACCFFAKSIFNGMWISMTALSTSALDTDT